MIEAGKTISFTSSNGEEIVYQCEHCKARSIFRHRIEQCERKHAKEANEANR